MAEERKLHWAGAEGDSIATVIPKVVCKEAEWKVQMQFFTHWGAGIARTSDGQIKPGRGYEPLCGDATLEAVRTAMLNEGLSRGTRRQLGKLISELEKFRGPGWF